MGLNNLHSEQITVQDPCLRVVAAGTATLKPYQRVVTVRCPTDNAIIIRLGSPSECAGEMVSVRCLSIGSGSASITIKGEGTADDTLTAAAKFALYYSDGLIWYQLQAN